MSGSTMLHLKWHLFFANKYEIIELFVPICMLPTNERDLWPHKFDVDIDKIRSDTVLLPFYLELTQGNTALNSESTGPALSHSGKKYYENKMQKVFRVVDSELL
jgi:hypothetical protein